MRNDIEEIDIDTKHIEAATDKDVDRVWNQIENIIGDDVDTMGEEEKIRGNTRNGVMVSVV